MTYKSRNDYLKFNSLFLTCGCGSLDHMVHIGKYDNDEEYLVSISLNHFLPWYKRLVLAIKYVFGKTQPEHWQFTEFWFTLDQMKEIEKFVKETKKRNIFDEIVEGFEYLKEEFDL